MNKIFDEIPKSLDVDVAFGHIEVRVRKDAQNAAIVLDPMTPGDEEALKAIDKATITLENGKLSVLVKLPNSVVSGRGHNQVSIVSGQTLVGITMVNGRIISGGGPVVRCDGVRATVYLPPTVKIHAASVSATIQVIGKATRVTARSTSGDVVVEEAEVARLSSVSGDVRTGKVDSATISTTSGDIATTVMNEGSLESVSGDVRALTATEDFTAKTVSGDLRIVQEPGVDLPHSALYTVSGRRSLSNA